MNESMLALNVANAFPYLREFHAMMSPLTFSRQLIRLEMPDANTCRGEFFSRCRARTRQRRGLRWQGDGGDAGFSDGIKKLQNEREERGDEQKNNGQRQSFLWPLQTSDPAEIPFIRL